MLGGPFASRSLPDGVSGDIQKVYKGFQKLLSLKFLITANDPSPYTWGFIQAWTDLPKRAVEKAMRWLISRGYVRFVRYFGDEDSGYVRNPCNLFHMSEYLLKTSIKTNI